MNRKLYQEKGNKNSKLWHHAIDLDRRASVCIEQWGTVSNGPSYSFSRFFENMVMQINASQWEVGRGGESLQEIYRSWSSSWYVQLWSFFRQSPDWFKTIPPPLLTMESLLLQQKYLSKRRASFAVLLRVRCFPFAKNTIKARTTWLYFFRGAIQTLFLIENHIGTLVQFRKPTTSIQESSSSLFWVEELQHLSSKWEL